MFFDLNVPVPSLYNSTVTAPSRKGKGKQPETAKPIFSQSQIAALETRVDLLVRLGYTIIAFNQLVHKKVDPKAHVNTVDPLLKQVRQRPGIVFLKRLTIVLDEDSEKGFGLTAANASLFPSYDLIALVPLTQATFSLACLTHSSPSSVTAHIISLPLTLPRLSFRLKHTLVRTAVRNGAVFEISYVGALGGHNDALLVSAGGAENGAFAKRNWWAAAREVVRVTKGKNIVVSGGIVDDQDLRAPKDVANLITILGLAQDAAHTALTKTPKLLVLRAQTRQTYRAVLSEPKLVVPEGYQLQVGSKEPSEMVSGTSQPPPVPNEGIKPSGIPNQVSSKKRPREGESQEESGNGPSIQEKLSKKDGRKKKKRKRNNNGTQDAP